MERWHIPFDYTEENWTASQMVCLTAAVIENAKEDKRQRDGSNRQAKTMDQYTAEQNMKAGT